MWAAVNEVILAFKRSNASLQINAMPSTLADKNLQLWQLWLHQLNFSLVSLVAWGSLCWTTRPSCWCSSRHVNKRGITCSRTSCELAKRCWLNIGFLFIFFYIYSFIYLAILRATFLPSCLLINPQYHHDISATMFQGRWYFGAHEDRSRKPTRQLI